MMGDFMYFHQAIRQPDAGDFVKAVVKEVEAHVRDKHWVLVKREEVPPALRYFQQYGLCAASAIS